MSDEPQQAPEPEPVPAATQPGQPAGPPVTPGPPQLPASERVRLAVQRRGESDYIFRYWSALGWTILTFGIYGLYVFYQLVRRMRDHNARRLELLDAATTGPLVDRVWRVDLSLPDGRPARPGHRGSAVGEA